ncbi:MAG: hypothetical protein AAGD25_23470 [Cyanobacteria bacterium P01_F01_bin.150]
MKSIEDELIAEIQQTPITVLQQVLNFLRFLKQTSATIETETDDETWPPDFFEEVIGGWSGEPLVRDKQPDYPVRESLR